MTLRKKIVTLCSAAVLVVGAAFGVGLSLNNASAEEWTTSVAEWEWQEEYNYASTFQVPAYKVVDGDVSVDATSVVTYPNGKTTTETTIILDVEGRYTVTYYASVAGKEYSTSESFVVKYAPFYIHDSKSSVVQGVYTGHGADEPENEKFPHSGLIVRLAKDDRLEFTKILDVNDLSSKKSLVEGFVTPDSYRVADFERVMITLTDIVDPSVYVDVEINRWWMTSFHTGKASSFVMAGANGQDMVGFEPGKGLHINDGVGTPITHTFEACGYLSNGVVSMSWGNSNTPLAPLSPSRGPFKIAYDNANKQVYANGGLVSDLDSVDYYKELWSGFPSGKVRLSVWANDYLAPTANFCLTQSIAMPDLLATGFEETDPPKITVDTDYDVMPEGQIGVPYAVPTATAFDDYSGVVDVEIGVWYNYESSQPVSVSLIDGKFTPTKNGYYSIVYRAVDAMGNQAEYILPVHAGNPIPKLTVANPANVPTTALLGHEIVVEQPTITGGAGKKVCVVTVKGPEDETAQAIVDGFIPDVTGKWVVTYTVTDYLNNVATSSFEVDATPGTDPFIYDTPVLPQVLMSGIEYVLPNISAYDYSTGRCVEKPCDVKVKIGNEEKLMKAGDKFVPTVTENGQKVSVTYFSGNVSLETIEVPCVIIRVTEGTKDSVKVQNYFYGENFTFKTTDDNGKKYKGIKLEATADGDISWTFANPQLADTVAIKLSSIKGIVRYKGFAYTLTDTQNPEEKVTLTVEAKGTGVIVRNGAMEVQAAVDLSKDSVFEFRYEKGRVYFGDKTNFSVATYDNGETFNGFSSDKVFMSVTLDNARAGAGYLIQEITGSSITEREADRSDPNFAILGDAGGTYSINTTYTLAPAVAGDTFAANTSLVGTVKDPDGEIVVDKQGVKLENVDASKAYMIELTKYGRYTVEYVAKEVDWFDGEKKFVNYVFVMDEIAPTVQITSDYTKTVKVGETIIIPNFKVSDNLTAEEELTIDKMILNPTGRTIRLPASSNSLVAMYEGKYQITIMVKDAYGNVTTIYLGVEVTK